jgi:hypothetical protein
VVQVDDRGAVGRRYHCQYTISDEQRRTVPGRWSKGKESV